MKHCINCDELLNPNENVCRKCGAIQKTSIIENEIDLENNNLIERTGYSGGFNTCFKCGSNKITVKKVDLPSEFDNKTKILCVIFSILTLGIFIFFIPKIKNKTEKQSCFVCENCGNYWKYE